MIKLRHFVIFILIVVFILYKIHLFVSSPFRNYKVPIVGIASTGVSLNPRSSIVLGRTNIYRILLWTKYFGTDSWSQIRLNDLKCKYSNCIVTDNRNHFDRSDAVLFHWRDVDTEDLPEYRVSGQKWVLYNWESPEYSPVDKITLLEEQIDWTMSYRYDSDIFVPYGKICNCRNSWQIKYPFQRKNKSIAWIVSNCQTQSKREVYAEQLAKYIDIDVFGYCGHFHCTRHSECYQMIAQNYKFYLSFENSLCKDYVTEKLFRIIQYDIIPIVLGSADYEKIMPTHSYINVLDFSSPKDLANYLKDVGSDEDKYNSYLKWKNNFCVSETNYTYFCDLCQKLNRPQDMVQNNKNKSHLIEWWFKQANCTALNNSLNIHVHNLYSSVLHLLILVKFVFFYINCCQFSDK